MSVLHGAVCCRIDPSWWTRTILFQTVLHNWCNKGHGKCYPVCVMVYVKYPLLLIKKSSSCSGGKISLSLFALCQHITVLKICC